VREKKEPFLFNIIHFNNQVMKNLLHVRRPGVEIFFLNIILFFLTMGSNRDEASSS